MYYLMLRQKNFFALSPQHHATLYLYLYVSNRMLLYHICFCTATLTSCSLITWISHYSSIPLERGSVAKWANRPGQQQQLSPRPHCWKRNLMHWRQLRSEGLEEEPVGWGVQNTYCFFSHTEVTEGMFDIYIYIMYMFFYISHTDG